MNTMSDAPADGGYPAGAPDPHSARFRTKRWFRWGAGAVLAGFLVGGGITLAAVSGSGTAVAGSASSVQAAALNTALGDAANPAVPPARVRWALGRLRRLGGVDGTATFHTKTGFRTISFQRGTIQSVVSGGDVVVQSADGTTWTWHIVSNTVVRQNGSKTTASALSAGETVFAGGPVVSGARDARLIVIRPDRSSPTGSQSAQTSLS